MSSDAERIDWPPPQGGEVVPLKMPDEAIPGAEFEEIFFSGIISDKNRRFIMQKALEYEVDPREIINNAIESYADLSDLVIDGGGKLFVLGRDGRMHPINTGDVEHPPAS